MSKCPWEQNIEIDSSSRHSSFPALPDSLPDWECSGREHPNQLGCGAVETSGGDYISGYTTGLAAHRRITQSLAQFREVSGLHQWRGHRGLDGGGPAASEELEVSEEKCLVLPYRPTDRGAVLVLGKVPSGNAVMIVEVGVRVERAIAEVLPDISVERIAAGLDAGVYHRAGRRAEFRGVGSRLNPELCKRQAGAG